jgi:uracil-DNA glycosylase family protein
LTAPSLTALRRSARDCRRCELYEHATQTVFGKGPAAAELVLVGEQPGDKEDLEGRPFVGPAGRVLDEALERAGVQREDVYLTNAVKHFKWRERGKRRLHDTPRAPELNACRPWLESELAAIQPSAVLALGAVAARSLFGPKVRVTRDRGRLLESELAPVAAVTIHPSAVLRIRDREERHAALDGLVDDLELVRSELRQGPVAP